jgi:hypothetical protein
MKKDIKHRCRAKKQYFDEAEYYADKSLAIYPTYVNANQIKSGLVAERYLRDGDLNKLLNEVHENTGCESTGRIHPSIS